MLLDDVAGEGLADIARPVIGRHLIQETTVQNAWGDVVGDMWVSRPGPPRSGPCGRGLHSSTIQLNVSDFCGIGVAFMGYLGGVARYYGGSGCILCQKRLWLS